MGRCGKSWGTFSCLPELGSLLQMTAVTREEEEMQSAWSLSEKFKYNISEPTLKDFDHPLLLSEFCRFQEIKNGNVIPTHVRRHSFIA